MDWDEERPKPASEVVLGAKLDTLSIADLEGRVGVLKGEIERVEAELRRRRAGSDAARALFKD